MTDDQQGSSDSLSVMDSLARFYGAEGTYFPNAVATTPLCCPSRASVFSGRYAHNHGVLTQDGTPFDPTTSLQFHLKGLGYKTALTGNKYLHEVSGKPPYIDLVARRSGYYSNGIYSTNYIRDKAVSFLNTFEQNDSQPWLMYVNTTAPHEPATPETKYQNAFVPAWQDDPARTETDRTDKPPYVQRYRLLKTDLQKIRALQIRTLYSVDDLIESVFNRMGALGEDNTIAFFTSDNGYMWYEHGLKQKRHVYTHSVKIPMFVRWPGHIAAGAVDSDIVANIDIAPTVYDALGYQPTNYTIDGRSMFSSARDHILLEYFKTENVVPAWKALWTPTSTYAEYTVDGFKEYYAPDDPWQLDNGFKTGDPPINATALHDQLVRDSTCIGLACP